MKTAVVIGSTGLVGSLLIKKLVQDNSFQQIIALVRNKSSISDAYFTNSKMRLLEFNFKTWPELELQIKSFAGQTPLSFFCCLGSTIKKAGSEEAFRVVDHDYVVEFAKLAQLCKAEQLLVVSALGADKNSKVFYNKVKGETEGDIENIFKSNSKTNLHFLRPSLLVGDRNDFRLGERLAILLAPVYSPLLLGSLSAFKPVLAADVAQAMVNIATKKAGAATIVDNLEIMSLAKK